MEVEKKLEEMGLELFSTEVPRVGNWIIAVRTGNLLFTAGHGPRVHSGGPFNPGQLGRDLTVEQGYEAARQAMVHCLSTLKATIGDLDKVKRVVKLLCMINSAPGFGDHPEVANGASDLLVSLYGDRGRHARSAVGVTGLVRDICIEIEMIVELED